MGRPAHALLFVLALAGCGEADLALAPPPGLDAAGSVLFVLENDVDPPRLFAAPADATRLFDLDLPREERTRITALGYPTGLGTLGLEAGEVELIRDGRCGARPLPPEDSLHGLLIDDGSAEDWAALDTRPAAVQDLRVDGPCPCRAFDAVRTVDLPRRLATYFEDPPSGRLLLLDWDGNFTWLDDAGDLDAVPSSTTAPTRNLFTVERQDDGVVWLANGDGELWRGVPGQTFELAATLSGEDFPRHIAGGLGADGFELYGATDQGYVVQLAPGTPRVISEPRPIPLQTSQRARVLWLGPGRIVASQHQALELVWLTDGAEVGRNALPLDSNGTQYLASVPELGVVVLSQESRIFDLDGFDLRARLDAPELSKPTGFAAFEGGYVYAGDTGYVQELRADYGFCPTQFLDKRQRVLGLAPMGTRFAVIVFAPGSDDLQAVLLEPRPLERDP